MILLDTHAWVWFVGDPSRLSKSARKAVDGALEAGELAVSSMSVWEVAMLVKKGRLKLTLEAGAWVARCEAMPFLKFLPVSNAIAMQSVELPPPLHADPADRIIVATALQHRLALITKDRRLRDYEPVRTIW